MPYDRDLDNSVFTKPVETDMGRLSVNVYSYNNGPKKLQISRETRDKQDNLKFAKLGRITKNEMESLLPLIQEALAHMD